MLGWRLAVSAVLIPLLIGLFVWDAHQGDGAPVLFVFCQLLAARSVFELLALCRKRDLHAAAPAAYLGTAAVVALAWSGRPGMPLLEHVTASPLEAMLLAFTVSILIVFAVEAARFRAPGRSISSVAAALLVISYAGVLLGVTAQLRWVAGASAGYLVLGSLVIAAKFGDIGAYTIGRIFGKKKLVPLLSPGKTWAGAWGALGGAGLGAILWLTIATPLFDSAWKAPAWWWSLLYGVVIGLAGLVGDLCESLIKRDAEEKDSAALMPGFGGLLDLLDSVLYAGPVAYLLWRILPLAT